VQLRVYGCRWTHVTAVQAAAAAAALSMFRDGTELTTELPGRRRAQACFIDVALGLRAAE
jgi:hypothetical protein